MPRRVLEIPGNKINYLTHRLNILTCTLVVASKIPAAESSGYVLLEHVQANWRIGRAVRTKKKHKIIIQNICFIILQIFFWIHDINSKN